MKKGGVTRRFAVICTVAILFITSSAIAGQLFCAVSWDGDFTHIDSDYGIVSPTRNDLPDYLQALAWSPDGTLYAGREGDIYAIDPLTGNYSHVLSVNTDIRGMAFSSSDSLYITSEYTLSQKLRRIDMQTGNYTELGLLWGDGKGAQGLEFSPEGVLYAIYPSAKSRPGESDYWYELYTVDVQSAEMHLIGEDHSDVDLSQSLAFAHNGSLYAVGGEGFAQLDPYTGKIVGNSIRLTGPGQNEYRGLAIVPEPATLLLLGLGGLTILRRRK